MPSSAFMGGMGRTPLSALRGGVLSLEAARFNEQLITALSFCALGSEGASLLQSTPASSTYPSANRALAFPFAIAAPFLVRKVFWFNGTTVGTDSADVGVYTEAGARIVSGGGTLTSGASALQEVDVTDTLLKPGRYWLAYAQNGVTATPWSLVPVAGNVRSAGCAQMDTAYVLPATFTPAAVAGAVFPLAGIASRTLAA